MLDSVQHLLEPGSVGIARDPAAKVADLREVAVARFEADTCQLCPVLNPYFVGIVGYIAWIKIVGIQELIRNIEIASSNIFKCISQHMGNVCTSHSEVTCWDVGR